MPRTGGRTAGSGEQVVVHLTDPHLFEARALTPRVLFDKRLLGGVNALLVRQHRYRREVLRAALETVARLGPDHVVVTGDISTLGARAELEAFRELLERLPLGPADVTVVPGNHDAYVPSLVEAGHVDSVLGPFMTSDPGFDGQAWPREAWPRVRLRGTLAIVSCSTSRPSAPFLALGTLGEAQLGRLDALLADPRLEGCFRLVLLHHPPQGGVGHWHNRLTDAAALRALLARRGAELVLHGHLHKDLCAELPGPAGPVPVRGAASVASAREPHPASFWVHRISGPHLVGSSRWIWRAGEFGEALP